MPVDVALHEYFRQQAALGSPGSAQFAATRLLALHIGATCCCRERCLFPTHAACCPRQEELLVVRQVERNREVRRTTFRAARW